MNIEEKMMPIDEWNKQFSCKYMQQPISFLTEEKLDKLKQHCEKTIQYGNGRILEEHQVTLELIIRYKELQQELEKENEKNKSLENELIVYKIYTKQDDLKDFDLFLKQNYVSKKESEQKERKAYIKGTNDAHELCNKKWEDKIKAKIDEVCESTIEESNVDILYSLLEKE